MPTSTVTARVPTIRHHPATRVYKRGEKVAYHGSQRMRWGIYTLDRITTDGKVRLIPCDPLIVDPRMLHGVRLANISPLLHD